MLTIFSLPKPFEGAIGRIQTNAVRSWSALGHDVQVVLLGSEPGIEAAARDAGVEHVATVDRNEFGTPRIDAAFAQVETVARHPLRCFVNADIIFLDDFLPAVERAKAHAAQFLMVGTTRDLTVEELLDLHDPAVRTALRARVLSEGRSRGPTAIDYFVFTAGLFDPMPPFVVGRARFDNWLVWRGRQQGDVIDAGDAVTAVHQRHDYGHVAGGLAEAHFGEEALRNHELAGGSRRIYTLYDASHVLGRNGGVRRNLGAFLRTRETLRRVAWKLRLTRS